MVFAFYPNHMPNSVILVACLNDDHKEEKDAFPYVDTPAPVHRRRTCPVALGSGVSTHGPYSRLISHPCRPLSDPSRVRVPSRNLCIRFCPFSILSTSTIVVDVAGQICQNQVYFLQNRPRMGKSQWEQHWKCSRIYRNGCTIICRVFRFVNGQLVHLAPAKASS